MSAVALLPRRCKVCGEPVTEDTSRARAGMTVNHTIPVEEGFDPVCRGSRIRFASQPIATASVRPTKRVVRTPLKRSVVYVDFLEARVQRALGHVTERSHARRFIRAEVRDA